MSLTTADEISDIAFAYMGSKALFAALDLGVFTELSKGEKRAADVAAACGIHTDRAETLLTALAGLGLVITNQGFYSNAPAAERFLVKGAKHDFGDYLRLQVGRQMYPLMDQIGAALTDTLPSGATASYADWFADPEEARLYSESQHAGSLGPARQLASALDLSHARSLLDVGGGTGAFAITLCKANPKLSATVVDFPNVVQIGRDFVEAAGLTDRITFSEGDALKGDWPGDQDVILMSYLFSGVPGDSQPGLIAAAHDKLAPGGILLIHDFIVDADRSGPKLAALWQLQHTAFTPKARSLDAGWLRDSLMDAGFRDVGVAPLIPEMTMLAVGRRERGAG